jgi:hypothetical protein
LTRELLKIMEERQRLKRKIKDIFTANTRENTNTEYEVRIKIISNEIEKAARAIRDQLQLFQLLKRYQEGWEKG